MISFLEQVARHYVADPDLAEKIFVFPNRRSMIFFRKYLAGESSRLGRVTLLPRLLTVSDFFEILCGRAPTDRITLLLRLYDCYKGLKPDAESLDDFIFWGDVILGDFDDIDKYLVDARRLFANIGELRSLDSSLADYTDQRQKEAITRLLGHFPAGLPRDSGKGRQVKESFRSMWNLLYPLYKAFRESLSADGLAYEGMVYRQVAESVSGNDARSVSDLVSGTFGFGAGSFVFTGLNALNSCERAVMLKMRNARMAEFCWDWGAPMVTDEKGIASLLMRENLRDFPNAFEPVIHEGMPEVHVCGVPSGVGQAKLLPEIIRRCGYAGDRPDFAVVLPDDSLLMPLLSSIPSSVGEINVTMGSPLGTSEWNSLMRSVLDLQLRIRYKDGSPYFYHKPALDILGSPLVREVLDESESAKATEILSEKKFYFSPADFGDSPVLGAIFKAVLKDVSASDREQISSLAAYQLEVTEAVASRLGEGNALQKEFAVQYYKCVNRLKDFSLAILPRTWMRLLDRLCAGISVPFEGEPLAGLQVMGPLETRALDFDTVVILGANEGTFPSKGSSPSFVPSELRLAFGLPTYRNRDAIWAYYFFRLISRASQVWMLYDTRSGGLSTGEESRYIKQLRYRYSGLIALKEHFCAPASGSIDTHREDIPKTGEDIEKIKAMSFSASSVQAYMACPAKFYFSRIKQLQAAPDIQEGIDAAAFGNICHEVLYGLYKVEGGVLTADYLASLLNDREGVRNKVHDKVREMLRTIEVGGADMLEAENATSFIMNVLRRDLERIGPEGTIRIRSLEEGWNASICGRKFYGKIDRLEELGEDGLRVVDYKTGSDSPSVLEICDADMVFEGDSAWKYKAALQFFIYDRLISKAAGGRRIVNSMYAMNDISVNPVRDYESQESFMKDMESRLGKVLDEMEDGAVPFVRNSGKLCEHCDFKALCDNTGDE